MRNDAEFSAPISRDIWDLKYRLKSPDGAAIDASLDDTFWRVARAAALTEKGGKKMRDQWAARFHDAIADLGFLPAGRILAGAGTGRSVTLFNCFVLGKIEDDLSAIFEGVKDAALTMQQGGGIGHDFSTLRPKGARVASIGADASGPVSFMDVWDAMCRTIMSAGSRRGAMMATLRCDHPDIEAFIDAKSEPGRLRNFNLSVLVTDAFLAAVRADRPWDLKFDGKVYRTLPARALWERIMRATYDFAEPGVVFIDRVNARNNLTYCERSTRRTLAASSRCRRTAPACWARSISHGSSSIRSQRACQPRPHQAGRARCRSPCASSTTSSTSRTIRSRRSARRHVAKRRIGLGVTGLADALIFSGVRYGTPAARRTRRQLDGDHPERRLRGERRACGREGRLPAVRRRALPRQPQRRCDSMRSVREAIRRHGIRNGCLTSIAPTGTISLLAGNVSSGVEPVFDFATRAACWQRRHGAGAYGRGLRPRPVPTPVRCRCAAARDVRARRRPCLRPSISPCRRHCSRTSTAPSPRPSTARRTSPSRRSRTSISRPTPWASKAAPPTGRMR